MTFSSARLRAGLGLTLAASATLFSSAGCFLEPPAAKPVSHGKYDEWKSYEGKDFLPKTAGVKTVDATAGTITLDDKDGTVLHISPQTRILHNNTDVPLAQVPAKGTIKYTLSDDGQRVTTVWFGSSGDESGLPKRGAKVKQQRTTYF